MTIDVVMPQMGESIFEGTITKWLKKTGDAVQKDEHLFEISTDKADAEIPSPGAGVRGADGDQDCGRRDGAGQHGGGGDRWRYFCRAARRLRDHAGCCAGIAGHGSAGRGAAFSDITPGPGGAR